MPEILIKDFGAGWLPGDDPVQGRKNGLLQMDNLELDTTGALSLCGGTNVRQSGYPANAHTLFSRLMSGTLHDYLALADGSVYRDATGIVSGGDTSNAAFGTAFNFTLIASGQKRVKDVGSGTPVNLGVLPPTVAPTVAYSTSNSPYAIIGSVIANIVDHTGTHTIPSGIYLQETCDSNGVFIIQTYNDPSAPYSLNKLFGVGGASNTGNATDSDYVQLTGYTPIVAGRSLEIQILLAAGDSSGDPVSDYYVYQISDLSALNFTATGNFTIRIRRSDFMRVGVGSQDWSTVYGFRLYYNGGAAGEVVNILGNALSSPTLYMVGGDRAQNGQYQYLQVNVNDTGSYQARSIGGPLSVVINLDMGQTLITPQDPSGIDAQVNQVWIYRRGGLLDQWYRVKVFTSSGGYSAAYDTLSDQDALTLNLYLNINLVSIAYSTITDKIYDIVGPINGRWYYFTTNFMYPSDINNPDLVDPTIAIRICGSSSELFMWARQVNSSTVLVGTSIDVYSLSGTFATFPDNSIDAYYLPIGCKYPPITCDAASYGGSVYYLAADGWRMINGSGQATFVGNTNVSLVSPTLDRLYRGETCAGYQPPNLKVVPRSVRFPVAIAKNKLWFFITGLTIPRIEVYDTLRQYWRPVNYGIGDYSAATVTPDGRVIAFCTADKKLREIDYQTSKLIDGSTNNIPQFLSMVFDDDLPRNRKDSATAKIRLACSNNFSLNIVPDGGSPNSLGTVNLSATLVDRFFDLSQISNLALVKTYQVSFNTVGQSYLVVDDISILFDPRPEQRSFLRLLNSNFGTAAKKRVRTWPFVIDTLGHDVTFTPIVDDSATTATTLNTNTKDTRNTYFSSDVQGVDYGGTFYCSTGLFEFYESLTPEIVQVFPVAKRFDQIGPEEFFRYGKILKIELRLLASGTPIPYNIYFQDTSSNSGTLTTVNGKDQSYFITVPKGTSGSILRIELGPTAFDFLRFYARIQVQRFGQDSDLEWINI